MYDDLYTESLFLEHLGRDGSIDAARFEALCAALPDRAGELRRLRSAYELGVGACRVAAPDPAAGPSGGPDARYTILREVGRGGMGVVHEAWDNRLRRSVAIKSLRRRNGTRSPEAELMVERSRLRLLEEAQVVGQLQHPGVVPLHDVGSDEEGALYFTMPLVDGEDFTKILDRVRDPEDGEWTVTRAVGVLLRVAETMAFAHARGVLHRDIKPSNIMVGPFGETYVMDWGLAKVLHATAPDPGGTATPVPVSGDESSGSTVTTDRMELVQDDPGSPLCSLPGQVVGTPAYMAPEQADGAEDLDARADVYSLGAMLYHLLAGQAPYRDDPRCADPQSKKSVLARVRQATPAALPAGDHPAELVAITERAMQRDRERRYRSMSALADDLRAHLEGRVVRAHRTGPIVELRKWMQRHRAVMATLAVLLLVVVSSAVMLALLYQHAEAQRVDAERRLLLLKQNPPGFGFDLGDVPSLPSFHERFDDEISRPLRLFSPLDTEQGGGHILMKRRGPAGASASFALDDSYAVIRGDFDLEIQFEALRFAHPGAGGRYVGLAVRRARGGTLVAFVQRNRAAGSDGYTGVCGLLPAATPVFLPWEDTAGGLRIQRRGRRATTLCRCGAEWRSLAAAEVTDEPLMFVVYLTSDSGDDGEFAVRFDDLRFTTHGVPVQRLGPVCEGFDAGWPDYLSRVGEMGGLGVVNSRLVFESVRGENTAIQVDTDPERCKLSGDFDISFDCEVAGPVDAGMVFTFEIAEYRSKTPLGAFRVVASDPLRIEAYGPEREVASARPSTARSAAFRIRRTGAQVSLLVRRGSEWSPFVDFDVPETDARFTLALTSTSPAAGTRVAVDNLRIDGLAPR